MTKGIVKWFDMSKGFGFIETTDGKSVFVHFDQVMTIGYEPLVEGQEVTFIVREEPKGLCALDVRIIANSLSKSKPRKPNDDKARLAKAEKRKVKKPKSHKISATPIQTRSEAIGHARVRLWSG